MLDFTTVNEYRAPRMSANLTILETVAETGLTKQAIYAAIRDGRVAARKEKKTITRLVIPRSEVARLKKKTKRKS